MTPRTRWFDPPRGGACTVSSCPRPRAPRSRKPNLPNHPVAGGGPRPCAAVSFEVLHLFADLLDLGLDAQRLPADWQGLGLRGDGVRLPVHLLHDEIQRLADRPLRVAEGRLRLLDIAPQSDQLLGDVDPPGQERDLLLQAPRIQPPLPSEQVRHTLLDAARVRCRQSTRILFDATR